MSETDRNRFLHRSKFKQPKLAFESAIKKNSKCEAEKNIVGSEIELVDNIEDAIYPTWLKKLHKFFAYHAKSTKDSKVYYTLYCKICCLTSSESDDQSNKGNQSVNVEQRRETEDKYITDKCSSSFSRHLQRLHPEKYQDYLRSKSLSTEETTTQQPLPSFLKISKEVERYDKKNHKQKQFHDYLLQFIVLDCVPLQITEGQGFQNLIQRLDPKLCIPSRRTLGRMLTAQHSKVVKEMTLTLKELPPRGCHLILDIWSSKQKMSVIGFKGQFIKDWKMRRLVLGFKHFPEKHTGVNIKKALDDLLQETLKLQPVQIASVTADNASNVLSAFKVSGIEELTQAEILHEPCAIEDFLDDDKYSEVERTCADSDALNQETIEEFDYLNLEDPENNHCDESVSEAFNLWLNDATFKRNPCLAHLLQLAIKDAFSGSDFVNSIIKRINDIINFFHKSNHWYTKLRMKTEKLSLLKPCTTRWNSQYHCLKRILHETREKISFPEKINEVLLEAKNSATTLKTKNKIPLVLEEGEISSLRVILTLLEPFADFTDDLQGDGVTSSLVHIGLIHAVEQAESIDIGGDHEFNEQLLEFKNKLCDCVVDRFTTNKDAGEVVLNDYGKKRNIVTVDVCHEHSYIMASLLDPRVKTVPFEGLAVLGSRMENRFPTKYNAIEMLKIAVKSENSQLDQVEETLGKQPCEDDFSRSPVAKKKRSMFTLVQKVISEAPKETTSHIDEVSAYLKLPTLQEGQSPLIFWENKDKDFPNLSKLARKYLALPATSGSVERLFSVAGSLARSRRAKLSIPTIEKILCYQQILLNTKKQKV